MKKDVRRSLHLRRFNSDVVNADHQLGHMIRFWYPFSPKEGAAMAPAIAAAPAAPSTAQRPLAGSRRKAMTVVATSRASANAPAPAQTPKARPWLRDTRRPSPRARSRPPRARPSTFASTEPALAPTQGRATKVGDTTATSPRTARAAPKARPTRRAGRGDRSLKVDVRTRLL